MNQEKFDKALKEKLLEIFRFSISFFETNNIMWWACGGTMLGAVRHHNIIPWDDDIDIIMPREDFNRLLSLKDKFPSKYKLRSPHDEGYFKAITKICDTETTLWERQRDPASMGVYIDIFPLDKFDMSREEYSIKHKDFVKTIRRFELSKASYRFSELFSDIRNNHKGALLDGILSWFYPTKKSESYRKKFVKIEQIFNEGKGKYIASPTGVYRTREFYDSNWFEETIEVSFADFKVKIPKGYHHYLKVMYGDYMQLPPVEKRVTHHGQYYLNLLRNVSISDMKEDISANKNLIYE